MPRLCLFAVLALAACAAPSPPSASAEASAEAHTRPLGWRQHDLDRPQPDRVEPAEQALPTPAPSDAVVLIGPDGSGLDAWETSDGDAAPWTVRAGALEVVPGSGGIQSKERFGDVQLHVEWQPADEPDKDGQDRSNSGIFLVDGRYEVQVLDSWENATYADGRAAAIYGQFPPLADATRPPGDWQSYDIFFRMPRFGPDSSVTEPARLTVLHNGVLVQNNEVLPGMTTWLESYAYAPHGEGPIGLQDHGSPTRFRNLWVRRIAGRDAAPPDAFTAVELTDRQLDRVVGTYARAGGGTWRIVRTRDGVGLDVGRDAPLALVPVSESAFELVNTAGRVEVDLDGDTATGLTFRMGGGVYPATRTDGSDAP